MLFNKKRIMIGLLFISFLSLASLSFVTLSPQWCLSKEPVWRAEEMDLYIYVSEEYETKLNECFTLFDRDELNKYVTGMFKSDGKITDFMFEGEDHFKWIRFGNDDGFNEPWSVAGEFKIVFNSKRLSFKVNSVSGNCFPKNIDELTFVPVNDKG